MIPAGSIIVHVATVGNTAPLNASPYLIWKYPVIYFQDDWKVNGRLTLNLGLRWDYEAPVVKRYNRRTANFPYQGRPSGAITRINLPRDVELGFRYSF